MVYNSPYIVTVYNQGRGLACVDRNTVCCHCMHKFMKSYEQLVSILQEMLRTTAIWERIDDHYWLKSNSGAWDDYKRRKDIMFPAVKHHNLTGNGLSVALEKASSSGTLGDDMTKLRVKANRMSNASKHSLAPETDVGRHTKFYDVWSHDRHTVRFSKKDSFTIQDERTLMSLVVSKNNKAVLLFDKRKRAIVVKKTKTGVSIRYINTFPKKKKDRINTYVGLSKLSDCLDEIKSIYGVYSSALFEESALDSFLIELGKSYTHLSWYGDEFRKRELGNSFNFVHVPIPKIRGMDRVGIKNAISGYPVPKSVTNVCGFLTMVKISRIFDRNSINTLSRAVKKYEIEPGLTTLALLTSVYKLLFKYDSDDVFMIRNAPFNPRQLVHEYMETCNQNKEVPSLTIRSWKRMYDEHMRQSREIVARSTDVIEKVNHTLHNPAVFNEPSIDVEVITTVDRLVHEGAIQHHCVGSYANSINSGHCLIYSILYDGNRYTLEVNKDTFQVRGSCNADAPTGLMEILVKHFKYRWQDGVARLHGDYVPGDDGYRQGIMDGTIDEVLPF